jgi:hypothetical protein
VLAHGENALRSQSLQGMLPEGVLQQTKTLKKKGMITELMKK